MIKAFLRSGCAISLAVLATSGCNQSTSTCSRPADDVTVDASPDHIVDGIYYTAPYGGPYQDFPANRTMHFMHGLGKVPLPPVFWEAFNPSGTLAIAPGNAAELVGLDDQEIAVTNNTCSDFNIWFYAEVAP